MTQQAYDAWMSQVDLIVQSKVGVSVHDLEDFTSHDLFIDGATPEEGAAAAIENDTLYSQMPDFIEF